MLRNIAIALAAIAALIAALVVFARREESRPPAEHVASRADADAGTAPVTTSGAERRRGQRALGGLQQIAEESQRLMPQGYDAVFVSMTLEQLRAARPRVRRDTSAAAQHDDRREVWEEDDPDGARVIYIVGATSHLVTQVQFASRVSTPEEIRGHFDAMHGRYGRPTGIYDCPQTEEASPMRRFTWRHEGASLMEAVLVFGSTMALTLIVAANDDIGAALQRSHCEPIRSNEAIGRFPIAGELRGQQTPLIREVIRDR